MRRNLRDRIHAAGSEISVTCSVTQTHCTGPGSLTRAGSDRERPGRTDTDDGRGIHPTRRAVTAVSSESESEFRVQCRRALPRARLGP